MSDLRDAYKQWGETLRTILREPTEADIVGMLPVFHPIDFENMTVGEWLDFKKNLWQSWQIRQIIGLLMEVQNGNN